MKSTNQAGTNVMLYKNGKWSKENIDNLPSSLKLLDYTKVSDEVPDIRYPHSDMTRNLPNPRVLLANLNDESEDYLGKQGIYGMMSKPIFRTTQPIFQNSTIRNILLSAVNGYNLEYPNHVTLSKSKFKVFDQNKRERARTKTQEISKRGEIKGKVCMTAIEHDVYNLLQYLAEVIQEPGNFVIVTQGSKITVDEFMKQLSISGTMMGSDEDGMVFVPSKANKSSACEFLKKLLIVANYFSLNDAKWFLNPIDTAIYRPVKQAT
jgi:hypothetical protein